METTIGINIDTTTAREQELIVAHRNNAAYYEEPYTGSLKDSCQKIIEIYTDCYWELGSATGFLKDGKVRNSIIFRFYNLKGFDKKALRKDLNAHIKEKFEHIKTFSK